MAINKKNISFCIISILILFHFSFCKRVKQESGICSDAESSAYVLPYPVGVAYRCIEGYPPFQHDSIFHYAIDFDMPIGSTVTAARAGVVEFVESRYLDSDTRTEKSNVVVIEHGDGTFSRYAHLTHNGALVHAGDRVEQGDAIGLSGSSGSYLRGNPCAHLHFDVTENCSQINCQTIPVCFKNTASHPDGLQTGVVYEAETY